MSAVGNVIDFLEEIGSIDRDGESELVYRGHADMKKPDADPPNGWPLCPEALRDEATKKKEHQDIRKLIAWYPDEFARDSTTMERLARAQHYDLPTRLLDVTFNPLVALYFAIGDKPKELGEVVVLRVNENREKWYDSHRVACLANLAYLKEEERDKLRKEVARYPDIKTKDNSAHKTARDNRITKFNRPYGTLRIPQQPDHPLVRLIHFVQEEMPYFSARIDPLHLRGVLCVKPKKNSARILVQDGAFLLWGLDKPKRMDGIDEVRRIQVLAKDDIRQELDRIKINKGTMYPEIHNAARYLKEQE